MTAGWSVMTVDTSELEAFRVGLGRAGVRVGLRGAQIMRAGAFKMERAMKAKAAVDTGAMRNSVSTSLMGDGRSTAIVAEIGPTVDYAPFVELGTSVMGAQPFVGPAFDENIGGIMSAVEQLGAELLP